MKSCTYTYNLDDTIQMYTHYLVRLKCKTYSLNLKLFLLNIFITSVGIYKVVDFDRLPFKPYYDGAPFGARHKPDVIFSPCGKSSGFVTGPSMSVQRSVLAKVSGAEVASKRANGSGVGSPSPLYMRVACVESLCFKCLSALHHCQRSQAQFKKSVKYFSVAAA